MPIDPAGTTPGIVKQEQTPAPVHMRCKNGNCDSMLAVEIDVPGQQSPGHRMYQCCQCKRTSGIPVGGPVFL